MLWAMAAGEWSRAIALAAFVASYVGLALGRVPGFRIDRTGVAIIGAAGVGGSGAVAGAVAGRGPRGRRAAPRAAVRHDDRHRVSAPLRLLPARDDVGVAPGP